MVSAPPTVTALKQAWLEEQTRLLSRPLAPTRAWSRDQEELPEKAIDDALFRLNHRLQQHARRVWAPQATRHVAGQIDQLYWNAASAAVGGQDGDEGDDDAVEGLNVGADLAEPSVAASLPSQWDQDPEDPSAAVLSHPMEAKRYAELVAHLQDLAEQKQEASTRMARLKRIKTLLEPFGPGSSQNGNEDDDKEIGYGVQENLVTRNGEVEAELQRMRVLLARVGGRVSRLKEQQQQGLPLEAGNDTTDMDVAFDERQKVNQLLERF